jgi:perosamine synthetase
MHPLIASDLDRIPVAGPWITDKEISYVQDAVTRGWYQHANEYPQRFESLFAETVNRRFAVSLPSCTSGIHLALMAAGIGPGDEVLLPDVTWIASAAPVTYVGATPVFVDIDPKTWCLSVESAEAAITPRTRGIIPVNLYGNMVDYTALSALAEQHGITIIEDAAQSIGSVYQGRPAGSLGKMSVFSFHGSKTLTTGEGGMWVGDDESLYETVLALRDHGRSKNGPMFWNDQVGYKYKMSAMQAALGLAQLERLSELVERKRQIFSWYAERLQDWPGVTLNHESDGVLNTYWMVTLVLDPATGWNKETLGQALHQEGIDTRPFFYPLSQLPAFASTPGVVAAANQNKTSYALSPYGLNLPSALILTESHIERVCEVLKQKLNSPPN